jgi:NAD(P)-dependent dehydrogenase (short-subunit alcohol dehydrogenase family)
MLEPEPGGVASTTVLHNTTATNDAITARRAEVLSPAPQWTLSRRTLSLMSSAPITVVTGANSGIGRATALHLAAAGHRVYGTVRSAARAGKLLDAAQAAGVGVELVELDIASDSSVRDGFAEILSAAGRVDHLVNNAGVGGNGVVEETTSERFLDVMNVDLCGAVRCAQAVLPQMRERGSGTIVNITSVAGRLATIAQAPYVAAKWALEGISEQLAIEVAPFGIRVAIIEPGVTKSSIFGKNTDAPNESGAYDAQYARMLQMYAAGYIHATDAIEVGQVILHAIETDEPKLRYPVSWGGVGITEGRAKMTDEEWVALGRIESMDDYVAAFQEYFGINLAT